MSVDKALIDDRRLVTGAPSSSVNSRPTINRACIQRKYPGPTVNRAQRDNFQDQQIQRALRKIRFRRLHRCYLSLLHIV
jgi:hypothetical protein